jgi:hypothetical protein
MTEEQRLLQDACDASGIASEDLQEYRITADTVRLVAKDGRKWVVEIVRLNPAPVLDSLRGCDGGVIKDGDVIRLGGKSVKISRDPDCGAARLVDMPTAADVPPKSARGKRHG